MAFKHVRSLTVLAVLVLGGLVAAPAHATTAFSVSAALSKTNVTLGGGATLSGSVSPSSPGKSVTIQVRQPGSSTWSTLRTVTLSSSSRYSATVHPTKAGDTSYRVRKAASSTRSTGTSATRTLTAWRWRSLGGLPAASGPASGSIATAASVTLRGQTFKPALIQTPDSGTGASDAFYDLSGRCSKLDAWVSITSNSADDDQASAWLLGDHLANPGAYTNQLAHNYIHRDGDPAHIVRGSTAVSDIKTLDVYIQSVANGDKAGWGSPRLYCKF